MVPQMLFKKGFYQLDSRFCTFPCWLNEHKIGVVELNVFNHELFQGAITNFIAHGEARQHCHPNPALAASFLACKLLIVTPRVGIAST
jgi:hypothetical protein